MPKPSLLMRLFLKTTELIDRRIGWDKLPPVLGVAVLVGIRDALREHNLYDTCQGAPPEADPLPPSDYLTVRTANGSYNDLSAPSMGMANTRFGRNVPLAEGHAEQLPDLMDPNPRLISTKLLQRREFRPATTLNVLAAAWLQFETRDWFSHGSDPERMLEIPRPPEDEWPEDTIKVPATTADPTAASGGSTFLNTETHWWDASQIYGSNQQFQDTIRTHHEGKVCIDADGFIDIPPTAIGAAGGADGWWLGMELMGTIFMREHNAICDRLKAAYPNWNDDQLFNKARLINAALIAKIHTIEWTPAILGHPTLQIGMRANWFGLAGERVKELFGRLSSGDLLSGIPGSNTDHHTAPYSITEDFVTVYRMHPLVPDDYEFLSLTSGTEPRTLTFSDIHGGANSRGVLKSQGIAECLYSLGVAHPGAVTLHNSPTFMRDFERVDEHALDMIATDILRSRERGVPRYNDFRRALRLAPATSFDEISGGDAATAAVMAEIYGGDIEKVDTMVGMFGEKLPEGFGFSDTAFRIFVLMASRRLKSDRFYTVDFTPRVYTPEGMDWIDRNDMVSVLLRHYPELEPALRGQRNAFAPWTRL
ncbi:peroxidase family protein [Mycolicibacterium fortuitum]|uniref:peroxidase family protein n=1 Tax=Mycolicibacterium fortuitum TaxID=1766 RepID=UPI0007E9B450|nr:peroxidase family protein [Mycolicibacterium fortuitum]OBA92850.1 peroxidase [Mycolicibacterium fortuitum]OBI66970.1 peroxidase [Mycolicibacterium fortuitum]UBV14920.1 peroxidase [Mycolicibacterium fortuitum]UBV22133.1 peroxidase [Mycolicibacterium fortuitum]